MYINLILDKKCFNLDIHFSSDNHMILHIASNTMPGFLVYYFSCYVKFVCFHGFPHLSFGCS